MTRRTGPSASLCSESADEPGLDISSMIDVSFLLLIFFLVTSTIDPRETDLATHLPSQDSSVPLQKEPLPIYQVTLDQEGKIFANDELLESDPTSRSLPSLRSRLHDYRRVADLVGTKASVLVHSDDAASSQRFVDVMNCLAESGIDTFTLDK
ncbi:MAG: biopolymer transporter ExbD [Verrucomicrobiales bacterium]|nr:biopolymer transporter ExbD [Verrucomicrobiales bacterium]